MRFTLRQWFTLLAFAGSVILFIACTRDSPENAPAKETAQNTKPGSYKLKVPLGLDASSATLFIPEDNPLTEPKIQLGKRLFFDRTLSSDGTLSCASCHVPESAFSDPRRFSLGPNGLVGARQAPTLINRAFSREQFWDGRAASLEDQALGPLTNHVEMANKNIDEIVRRLKKIPEYVAAFREVFSTPATPTAQGTKDVPAGKDGHATKASSEEITPLRIYQAIASFERTILSGNSPFDRFTNGDKSAISESAQRGYRLFNGKANCAQCHTSFNFTDELYHNLGVGALAKKPDEGRYLLTRLDGQQGAFKTPTMREIVSTAPYMSDGSIDDLEDVIEFYDKGCQPNPWLSQKIKPLKLEPQDELDLMEFLKSLSGDLTWYGKQQDYKLKPFSKRTQAGS